MWFGVVPCLTHGSFARFDFKYHISFLLPGLISKKYKLISPFFTLAKFLDYISSLFNIARFYGGVPILPLLSESPQSPLPSIWLETKHGKKRTKTKLTRTQVLELGPRDGSLLWSGLVWSGLVL